MTYDAAEAQRDLNTKIELIRKGKPANDFAQSLVKQARQGKHLSERQLHFVDVLAKECQQAQQSDLQAELNATQLLTHENCTRLFAILALAGERLKYPKIRLSGPTCPAFRLSLASDRSRHKGDIFVTAEAGTFNETTGRTNRDFYGRIDRRGKFTAGRDFNNIDSKNDRSNVLLMIAAFAAAPADIASKYGRRTGNCCFCCQKLTDPRSTAVGYGRICAGNWGLPWGDTHDIIGKETA